MRIGLIADVHYCTKDTLCDGTRFPKLAYRRTEEAVAMFRRECVDLIVCLGDLINIDDTREADLDDLAAVSAILRWGGLPCVCLMGNHDCEAFTKEEFTRVTGLMTAPCHLAFGRCLCRFLDANRSSEEEAYAPGNVDWTRAYLNAAQLNDIRGDAEDGFAQHIYFVHQCVDPNVEAHHIIRNADAIRSRIERVAGAAVVEGHFHPGARNVVNGVTYITVPAICSGEKSSAAILDTAALMA